MQAGVNLGCKLRGCATCIVDGQFKSLLAWHMLFFCEPAAAAASTDYACK